MKPLREFAARYNVPLFLLGLALVNFGLVIPWLCLYGDDWQYMYSFHLQGAAGFPAFVAPDRPFSAWVYMLFTPLLGETPWAYHLLLMLLRWGAAVQFWLLLRQLPGAAWQRTAFAGATIILIYPGFKQQALPLEFILHFSVLNLTLFSLYAMLRAEAHPAARWKWTAAGVFSALGVFSVEYFTGLELLRPVLLWLALRTTAAREEALRGDDTRPLGAIARPLPRLRLTLLRWLPYAAVLALFFFWRVFIFQFQHYKPDTSGLAEPLKFVAAVAWKALDSLWLALVRSNRVDFILQSGLVTGFAWVAGLLSASLLLYLVLRREFAPAAGLHEDTRGSAEVLVVGALALVLAGPMYWLLDIPIQAAFPWDRPLLSFLPGIAIFIGGAITALVVPRWQNLVLALLCAAGTVANIANARTFIDEGRQVRGYVQQLTVRMPQVEAGTLLLTQKLPFLYYGENTFFPMLNWAYAPESRSTELGLRMLDLSIRPAELVEQIEAGQAIAHTYRSFHYTGQAGAMVAFTYQPPACLHVLSPDEADYPSLPEPLRGLVYRSDLSLIQASPAQPAALPGPLGAAPAEDWCSLYQRAGLLRQQGDWAAVAAAARSAAEASLTPAVGYEYLPFIEAYARLGDWEAVQRYFAAANLADGPEKTYLCNHWQRVAGELSAEKTQPITAQYCGE